jgi:hypothetical protein
MGSCIMMRETLKRKFKPHGEKRRPESNNSSSPFYFNWRIKSKESSINKTPELGAALLGP